MIISGMDDSPYNSIDVRLNRITADIDDKEQRNRAAAVGLA